MQCDPTDASLHQAPLYVAESLFHDMTYEKFTETKTRYVLNQVMDSTARSMGLVSAQLHVHT